MRLFAYKSNCPITYVSEVETVLRNARTYLARFDKVTRRFGSRGDSRSRAWRAADARDTFTTFAPVARPGILFQLSRTRQWRRQSDLAHKPSRRRLVRYLNTCARVRRSVV